MAIYDNYLKCGSGLFVVSEESQMKDIVMTNMSLQYEKFL